MPIADFRRVTMPLTAKQLRPLRVSVRAVSGVWGYVEVAGHERFVIRFVGLDCLF